MSKQGRMTNARLVPAVAGAILLLSACDDAGAPPPEYDYVTVCVENKGNTDPSDDVRLDDNDPRCPDYMNDAGESVWDDDEDGEQDWGHDWGGSFVFISTSSGYQAPAVGQPIRYPYGVTPYRPPALATPGSTVTYGTKTVPASGGTVTRGGFGTASSGSSGG